MEEKKTITVDMTADELEELKRFREQKAKDEERARKEAAVKEYEAMVDEAVREAVEHAKKAQYHLSSAKKSICDTFATVVSLREELYKTKEGRRSNTFTNSDSTARVTVGYNAVANYKDTCSVGIDMVNAYLTSLAVDENSKALTDMVRVLLDDRTKSGVLKPDNVLRLEQLASESKNEQFIDGVRIIRDAYIPTLTKQYVKVEVKGEEDNAWHTMPLSMTDCQP